MNTFTARSRYLRAALEYIAAYLSAHGYAPTLREIGQGIGFNSTGHASWIIDALEEDHFLEIPRSPDGRRLPRVMRLTPHAHAVLRVWSQQ